MFNLTTIKKLTRTSCLTLLMAGTLIAQSGTAATFKFSDFTFTRATTTPTTEFHNRVFYQTQKTTTVNGKSTTVTTDVKGADAFQQFVQKESSAIDLATLNARKLDPTKLKLKFAKKLNIYFINEGAGYKNQLKLVTTNGTNKSGLVFYDGSIGTGNNELRSGDYVTVGHAVNNGDVVKAETILDFQLRANGFNNPNGDVWYTDKTKNVDNLQHVIAYEYKGFLVLAWEDLNGGGDKDYNDIVFAVDVGQANLNNIPSEPPANQAPNANADTASTPYNTPVSIDVLANDKDPENQAMTITGAASLTGATVRVVSGKVEYTPSSDFNIAGGSDSFSYTIKDSQGATNSATVNVSVGAKPIPTTANLSCKNNNGHGNNADITITLSTGKTLTVSKFDPSNPGGGDYLTRAINGTGVSLTPSELTAAKAQLQQLVNDVETKGSSSGAGCAPAPNQAPMALNDNISTPNNTPVVIDVLANDVDPEGQAMTITSVTSTTGATVEKTTDGKVKYTPKYNSNKRAGISDTFTYTIKDAQNATASATVTVNVGEQANQAPKPQDDEVSTPKQTPVTVNVLANDSDPDGDPLTLESVSSNIGATVQIVNGEVKYTPKFSSNQAASESFTYTVKDTDGVTSSANVTVNVGANKAPVAVADQADIAYGAPVTVDVLANDSDPDDQTLIIKSVNSATGANVEVTSDNKVRYIPKSDFNKAGGSDTFTYIVEDIQGATDEATVTISIGKKPNGAPNALPDTASTAYGTPVSINVLANDSDPEGDEIIIIDVKSDTGAIVKVVNGQVVYTPKSDFNTAGDDDKFTYTIKDSEGNESSTTVTVKVGAETIPPASQSTPKISD
jgi:hypothetical protein